jgi:hypothetical protein
MIKRRTKDLGGSLFTREIIPPRRAPTSGTNHLSRP